MERQADELGVMLRYLCVCVCVCVCACVRARVCLRAVHEATSILVRPLLQLS